MKQYIPIPGTLFSVLAVIFYLGQLELFIGSALPIVFPFLLLLLLIVVYRKGSGKCHFHFLGLLCILSYYFVNGMAYPSLEYSASRSTYPADERVQLRVLTYNLFFEAELKTDWSDGLDLEHIDVLSVQELTKSWDRHIRRSIGTSHPYQYVFPTGAVTGLGIYSKYPLNQARELRTADGARFGVCAEIEHQPGGNSPTVCNIHLYSPSAAVTGRRPFYSGLRLAERERKRQVQVLKEEVSDTPHLMMMGDFNTMPVEPIYRSLRRNWVDVYDAMRWDFGWTFPDAYGLRPIIRIDYMFSSADLVPLEIEVLQAGPSDHLPMMAVFEWDNGA